MRVLVACEYSGIVRSAFSARGHEAWSCDLLPTESPGNHYQGDVMNILGDNWDLMVAHPPCTFLTNAANRWLYEDCATGTAEQRLYSRAEAIQFFQRLQQAPVARIAIENPEPHPFVIQQVGKYSDKIKPEWFGVPEKKGICLWLKNLPPLLSTLIIPADQCSAKVHRMAPGKDRAKMRSIFFHGVAAAMAEQWG